MRPEHPSPANTPARRRWLAEAALDATLSFLGRFEVCGVGMAQAPTPRITFLLRRNSPEARRALAAWAAERGAHIEIAVADHEP